MSIEFQNAYALSRRENPIINERRRAKELAAQGKFPVVHYWVSYCKFTDAIIGENHEIVSVHDTREAADAAAAQYNDPEWPEAESGAYVELPEPVAVAEPVAVVPASENDIPF